MQTVKGTIGRREAMWKGGKTANSRT